MLIHGNAIHIPLADETVHCVITSPPYWNLRDYGVSGQLGLETTPDEYVTNMVGVFREVRRVLRDDGVAWLNLGDSYASRPQTDNFADPKAVRRLPENRCRTNCTNLKPKDLVGIPWHVAFALRADGWWLRSDIIWAKPNPMPESVTDRPTRSHEYVFMLTKAARYYWDQEAVKEDAVTEGDTRYLRTDNTQISPTGRNSDNSRLQTGNPTHGRNIRSVWTIPTEPYPGSHYATFPTALVEPCVKAGTSERGVCPVCGKPWVRVVEMSGHVNKREPAHVPGNTSTKVDSTGWDPMTTATNMWRPTCKHDADPVPAIVLDPFCGSGTAGEVCRNLRRRFVGIDLSEKYLAQNALPRAEQKTSAAAIAELPMFGSLQP